MNDTGAPGAQYKITSHLLLEAVDRGHAGLPILHQDLFDSDPSVVLSALAVIGRLHDPRSLNLVTRLLNGQDEAIQAAAVQTLGAMGQPSSIQTLSALLKLTRSERVRCAILEALAVLAPQDPAILTVLRDNAYSQLASTECRACAASLLVRLEGEPAAARLLEEGRAEIVEAVCTAAKDAGLGRAAALQHGLAQYHRLPNLIRRLLISLAGTTPLPDSGGVLLEGLADVDPEVRRAAYQALTPNLAQLEQYPLILGRLSDRTDPILSLEEEALAAIDRLEAGSLELGGPAQSIEQQIRSQILELFKTLSTRGRQVASDSHELGWIISRSREYLEYYADEEFRKALLSNLKGGSYFTAGKLLAMLKATAVKVEVRHFDGYKSLADLIQNPKRPGIALVARELAIARLGKRETLYRLIRNLRLTRLLSPSPAEDVPLYGQIYTWAKEAKIYRLAEAALQALIRVDPGQATRLCEECLTLPVFSKICAIASLRLLRELDWKRMEPAVLRLLQSTEDPNILLNLIDVLCSLKPPLCGELIKALLNRLLSSQEREVLGRLAGLLGCLDDAHVLEHVTSGFERAEPWRQSLILEVIERRAAEGRIPNHEGLSEFLYGVLRSSGAQAQNHAAVLLWKLKDDYALKVLQDYMRTRDPEQQTGIIWKLQGAVNAKLVRILQPLLTEENTSLQEALRATLLSTTEEEARSKLLAAVLSARGVSGAATEPQEEADEEVQVDLFNERKAFRFEREHVQELAILFTDIQGYSKKAQALSSIQLSSLLQDYEGILLPGFAAHRGELIKKMGDGHMFVFQRPLDATLAAIRLQKALKRFNCYREESLRLVVRVGIHWGKVVCREGDVLGNHVNIASRLEGAARGGSILVSDAVYQLLQGQVHAREIGLIEVKNIAEPIKVFEPYEISIDLPPALDPLKRREADEAPVNGRKALILDRRAVDCLTETFAALGRLCQNAERGQVPVTAIQRELRSHWNTLRGVLAGGLER